MKDQNQKIKKQIFDIIKIKNIIHKSVTSLFEEEQKNNVFMPLFEQTKEIENKWDIKNKKNNNEIKTVKDIIDINNKPDKNKANNISFTSSNASKNQQDPNKEKNDQPIVHNTRIYLTKRRPSNKNVDDNIQIKEIKNETKTTTNENKNENKNDNEIKNKYRYNRYNRYKEEVKDTKKTIYSLEEKNKEYNRQ